MVPESAASMLNPKPEDGAENLGGSTREKGLPVFLRLRMPMRFLVGERPAGVERGVDREVSSLGAGERAGRIGRREDAIGLRDEKSFGEGGALVRKKFVGLMRSLELPSGFLERFGERKIMGSMFSELSLSASKAEALRLLGEERADNARGEDVRFMVLIEQQWWDEGGSGVAGCAGGEV
jgi:hypothetical protein